MKKATELKVKDRTLVLTVGAVIIIGVSMVIASLLPSSGLGNFYGGSNDVTYSSPSYGWCVEAWNNIGHHRTLDDCEARASDISGPGADGILGTKDDVLNNTTHWFAWCPDNILSNTSRISCKCTDSDIIKSDELKEIIGSRDSLIDEITDGTISPDDQGKLLRLSIATSLSCACPVHSAGNAPTGSDAERKITSISVAGTNITGVHTFIRKVAKMFSKMYEAPPECKMIPDPACNIGGSGPSDGSYVSLSDWNNRNTADPHVTGQALDMNCQEFADENTGGCKTKTGKLLGKVQSSSSGLNILQECTLKERACWGTKPITTIQIIHVDQKGRGGQNPNTDPCFYTDCNIKEVCDPVTPPPI